MPEGGQKLPSSVDLLIDDYNSAHPAFTTKAKDCSREASNAVRFALILNGYAALMRGLFPWCSIVLAVIKRLEPTEEDSFLWVCAFLLIDSLWIPLRVYSEWHRSFGSIKNIASVYPALGLLSLMLAIAIAVSFFLNGRGVGSGSFTLLATAVCYVGAILSAFVPEKVGEIGTAITDWGFAFYCILLLVFGSALLAVAYSLGLDLQEE